MSNNNCKPRNSHTSLAALRSTLVATAALTAATCGTATAFAQDDSIEIVVVTGYRASLESALNAKRMSNSMVDAINAEDVAKFPDANLAESLQRLPGVSVDMDNGEGRTISIRGLGADFTRVTINGMEALSTAGASNAGSNPNRSRQFDFNTFASELFSSLKVSKSSSAEADEGSLGATIGLSSGHPFDLGNKVAISTNNAWYETGHAFNPRIAALASHTWLGGRLGTLVSVAYNMRHQAINSFSSGAGTNFVYGAIGTAAQTFAGTSNPTTGTIMTRDGFAAPTGTACSGTSGVIPGANITNSYYCSALSGSDASAYDTVETSNYGHTINTKGTWVGAGPTNALLLPQLTKKDLYATRLGLTSSVQWQVDDNTLVSLDGLFSSFYQNVTNYAITDIGVNRNNTVAGLVSATSTTNMSTYYSTCTEYTESALRAANSCSFAKSRTVYDYYTNTSSVGYSSSDPNGMKHLIAMIGRPTTKLVNATVSNGIVNNMTIDNVDYRSYTDRSQSTTQFGQATAKLEHSFSNALKMDFLFGMAVSRNKQNGVYISIDSLDRGSASGDGYFSYATEGADSKLTSVNFGIDVSDPSNWDFIKGYSDIRLYQFNTVNKYRNISTNWSYELIDEMTLQAGFASRNYDFDTSRAIRVTSTGLNPSLAELGVDISQVTRSVSYDAKSVGLGGDTPTSWIAADISKFTKYTGLDCNCINDYGDWRLSKKNSYGSGSNITTNFGVSEHDRSYYLQSNFQGIDILGGELRGNIGLRYARTGVVSNGYSSAGYLTTAANDYDDLLPAANIVYNITDDMIFRGAISKVMARPQLGNMAPSITSISISSTLGNSGSISSGNPYLKPYRANDLDLSYEWYFSKGGLISVAGFTKWIKNNPQSMTQYGKLSQLLSPEMISALAANYDPSSVQYQNLHDTSISYSSTMYRNAPGGLLEGIEINYQQQMSFLPYPFDGLGLNANYTYVHSKMHYCFQDVNTSKTANGICGLGLSDHLGPWLGSSPNSINGTIYYDGKGWSGRMSASYRSKYVSGYPLRSGAYIVGMGTSPAITEFNYSNASFRLDSSFSYKVNEYISARVDASNLTNEKSDGYVTYNVSQKIAGGVTNNGRQVTVGFTMKY